MSRVTKLSTLRIPMKMNKAAKRGRLIELTAGQRIEKVTSNTAESPGTTMAV